MPLISKDIAKPPDIPGIPGDTPGNPSLGKKFTGIEALRASRGALADEFNTDPSAEAQFTQEHPIMERTAWQDESLPR
jgi:hypothetical protein